MSNIQAEVKLEDFFSAVEMWGGAPLGFIAGAVLKRIAPDLYKLHHTKGKKHAHNITVDKKFHPARERGCGRSITGKDKRDWFEGTYWYAELKEGILYFHAV